MQTTLRMSVSIDSFDANSYRAQLASTLNVPITSVQLRVQPGSLIVSVRVDAPKVDVAAQLMERMAHDGQHIFGEEAAVVESPHLTHPLLNDVLEREEWVSDGTNVDPSIQAEFHPSPPPPAFPPFPPPSPSPPPIRPPYPIHVRTPITRMHRESQRASVHALWSGLGFSSMHVSQYPCEPTQPDAWSTALECDQGHVIAMRAGSRRLTGTLSEAFGSLTELETLDLTNNRLVGTVPTEFGALQQLRSLQLDQNSLSGSIPTQVGRLTHLRRVSTFWNRLSGTVPSELGNLGAEECDLAAGDIWSTNSFDCPLPSQLSDACLQELHCGPLNPMALQYRHDLTAHSPPTRPPQPPPTPSPSYPPHNLLPVFAPPSLDLSPPPGPLPPSPVTLDQIPLVGFPFPPPPPPPPPTSPSVPDVHVAGSPENRTALETKEANVNVGGPQSANVGALTSLVGLGVVMLGVGGCYYRRRTRAQRIRKELRDQDQTHVHNDTNAPAARRRIVMDGDACTEDNSSTPREDRDQDVDAMLTPRTKRMLDAQSSTPQPSDLRASLLSARGPGNKPREPSSVSRDTDRQVSRLTRCKSRCLNAELQRLTNSVGSESGDGASAPSADEPFEGSAFQSFDHELLCDLNTSERRRLSMKPIQTFTSGDSASGAGVGIQYSGNASDTPRAQDGDDFDKHDEDEEEAIKSSEEEAMTMRDRRGGMRAEDIDLEGATDGYLEGATDGYLGDMSASDAEAMQARRHRTGSGRSRVMSHEVGRAQSGTNMGCPPPAPLPRPSRESMAGVRYGNPTILEEEERDFSNVTTPRSNSSRPSSNESMDSNGDAKVYSVLSTAASSEQRTSYRI